ncbi:hypothetical protein E4U32_002901 [Claviceps aff. humidiphila group G2b]|nr:hypothetical protein E4U32_002901 [Claviceps aff. humidiphila group G2b]
MKFYIVAFITLVAAIPPVPSPNNHTMQDQSPALLESNLVAISKIMPEMRKKARKHRKPRKKLQLVQCGNPGEHCRHNEDCCSMLCLHAIYGHARHRKWQCESVDGEDEG